MKIKYEMTRRAVGVPSYEPPDDLLVRETNEPDVVQAVEAFNEFLLAVYGPGWAVVFEDGDDDFAD